MSCVEFTREDTKIRANPRTKVGTVFTVYADEERPTRNSQVERLEDGFALQGGPLMTIHLQKPARRVVLSVSVRGPGGQIVGIDESGDVVACEVFDGPPEQPIEVALEAERIADVRIGP